MKRKRVMIAMAALLLANGLVSCGSPVGDIMNDIEQEKYTEAVDLVSSSKLSDSDKETLCAKLSEKIETTIQAYASDEIELKTATDLISTIQRMNLADLTSTLADATVRINALEKSKQSFANGVQYYQQDNYLQAHACFSTVIVEDGKHEDAVKMMQNCMSKYSTSILDKVDEYIQGKNYDAALSYLNDCKYEAAGHDEAETLITDLVGDVGVQNVLFQANEMLDQGDLPGALTTVSEYISTNNVTDKRLDEFVSSTKSEYVEMIMKKVSELSDQENYIAALNMIKNAKEVVQDDAFDQAEEKIMALKPTYLYDLSCTNSNRYEIVDTGDPLTDTIGNKYPVGNLFTISATNENWSAETGSAEYNLGYKYNRLVGIVSVSDESVNNGTNGAEAHAVLRIIGDDATLFSADLKRSFTPLPFDLDVSAVNWLKITIEDPENGKIVAILSDCHFVDAAATTAPAADTTTELTTETEASESESPAI